MRPKLKGYLRDNAIRNTIEDWGMLDIHLIHRMFFSGSTLRAAQHRMQMLSKIKKHVIRSKSEIDDSYTYYIKRHEQPGHRIATNWVRYWFMTISSERRSWEEVFWFEYDPNYQIIRPDGLVGLKNTKGEGNRFIYIEIDLSSNDFDKVAKYQKFFESDRWQRQPWSPFNRRFPHIHVFTFRPEHILKKVKNTNQNPEKPLFVIHDIENIRRECLSDGMVRFGQGYNWGRNPWICPHVPVSPGGIQSLGWGATYGSQ